MYKLKEIISFLHDNILFIIGFTIGSILTNIIVNIVINKIY